MLGSYGTPFYVRDSSDILLPESCLCPRRPGKKLKDLSFSHSPPENCVRLCNTFKSQNSSLFCSSTPATATGPLRTKTEVRTQQRKELHHTLRFLFLSQYQDGFDKTRSRYYQTAGGHSFFQETQFGAKTSPYKTDPNRCNWIRDARPYTIDKKTGFPYSRYEKLSRRYILGPY